MLKIRVNISLFEGFDVFNVFIFSDNFISFFIFFLRVFKGNVRVVVLIMRVLGFLFYL